VVVSLLLGELGWGSVEGVKALEGCLGPNAEAAEVTTGGELKEVETGNTASVNTRDVSEGLDESVVLVVDEKGSTSLNISAVSGLSNSTANGGRCLDLVNIRVSTNGSQDIDGLLGLDSCLNIIRNNERDFRDGLDLVSTGHDEGWDGGGSKSGGDSEAALAHVDLVVPLAPDLVG